MANLLFSCTETRVQLQTGKGTGPDSYNGMVDCFRKIIKHEGLDSTVPRAPTINMSDHLSPLLTPLTASRDCTVVSLLPS